MRRLLAILEGNSNVAVAVGLIMVLTFMVVPVPPMLMDGLLALSLSVAVAIMLVAVHVESPLDFSVFPTVLLITTLFRLSLNVATTRLILIHGAEGSQAAGRIIQVFGSFVAGGNYLVGMILFAILVIINFVVITKGSGRIAEVAARFTLDGLPGKQMAIDADLNAGLVTEAQARERRRQVEQEADFYGAMDGASKFVRGDAIAGLLITGINIVAGLVIGVLQGGLDLVTAAKTYTILTVGDGLVSQIPALLISTAAGVVVTRAAGRQELGREMAGQLLGNNRVLYVVAGFLVVFGLLPGMPFMTFSVLAVGMAMLARRVGQEAEAAQERPEAQEPQAQPQEQMEDLIPVDLLEMELGYGLIPLVDSEQGGDLTQRIVALRRSFATSMGILVPLVHIRDNLQLPSGRYVIKINGIEVGQGDLMPDRFLAMAATEGLEPIPGIPTKEPAFGLDAWWISPDHRDRAETLGYAVVDPSTVVATHLQEIIRTHAHELLGRQEVQELLEIHRRRQPKVVEELVPNVMSVGEVRKVLAALLEEGVSIRDMRTILETLADHAATTRSPEALTELVRQRLARTISRGLAGQDGVLRLVSLDPRLEDVLRQSAVTVEGEVQLTVGPDVARPMLQALEREKDRVLASGHEPVLLASPEIRRPLFKLVDRFIGGWHVLSHREIDPKVEVETLGVVGEGIV